MKTDKYVWTIHNWINRHWSALFAICLLFSIGLRLGIILLGQPTSSQQSDHRRYTYVSPRLSFTEGDAANYDQMARNLLAGRGLVYGEHNQYKAARAPLYPLLLALLYAVFGRSALTVGLAHVVLGVGTCTVVGLVGRRYLGPAVGLLGMLGTAAEPQLLKWSTRVYSETLMVLLVALVVLIHLWAARRESIWPAIIAGLSIGIATLCRQTILPFVLFGGAWLGFQWSQKSYPVVRNLCAYLLIVPLTLAPYTVHNYMVQGAATPLTTKAGSIVWGNNNPSAKTIWEDPPKMEVGYRGFGQGFDSRRRTIEGQSQETELPPLAKHERGTVKFLQFVLAQPLRYLELCVSRVMYMWNLWPTPPPSIIFFAMYWLLLAIAVIGALVYWKHSALVQISALLVVCNTLVHAATWAIPRYRVPVVPWVLMLAIVGGLSLIGAAPNLQIGWLKQTDEPVPND